MKWLDLFSGIGGFALGLQRAGHETVAFCEIDPFCRKVLAKHWPGVPVYDDVRTLTAGGLATDGIVVDAICGGFPCQDISSAGKGAGIDGERSGLWREFARLIRECRPDWVLVENVPALRKRGSDRVLGDLEEAGYACRPLVVGAVHAGAPHRRQRVWIVADAGGSGCRRGPWAAAEIQTRQPVLDRGGSSLADANGQGLAVGLGVEGDAREERTPAERDDWWLSEPDVGRMAHGIPARVDRLRSLGNAVVPQVVEMIGHAINQVNGRLSAPTLSSANETDVNASPHRASTVGDAICTMTETIGSETSSPLEDL